MSEIRPQYLAARLRELAQETTTRASAYRVEILDGNWLVSFHCNSVAVAIDRARELGEFRVVKKARGRARERVLFVRRGGVETWKVKPDPKWLRALKVLEAWPA